MATVIAPNYWAASLAANEAVSGFHCLLVPTSWSDWGFHTPKCSAPQSEYPNGCNPRNTVDPARFVRFAAYPTGIGAGQSFAPSGHSRSPSNAKAAATMQVRGCTPSSASPTPPLHLVARQTPRVLHFRSRAMSGHAQPPASTSCVPWCVQAI